VCAGLALLLLIPAVASSAWGEGKPLRYQLDLRAPATHLVQVTMDVPDAPAGLELQIPTWNCLYQIRDFVRNLQDVRAACDDQPLHLERVDLNTWRAPGGACRNLEVRYAVYADEESPFSSAFNEHHAFLNFAMLLFYLPEDRSRAAQVSFVLPPEWKVASLLEGAGTLFRAPNYDALADSPAEAGTFQEYEYTQQLAESAPGADPPAATKTATYRVIVDADQGDYPPKRLLASLQKITAAETTLMRDQPFSRYTFIFHFLPEGGGGGMEHRYGTAINLPPATVRNRWEAVESMSAHEFFHLWNVKRIRPQTLEPIDYIHGNDTRDLWFCEGVTSTYGELSLLRAGLISPAAFYRHIAAQIQALESRPARHYQSAELSGREAWLEKYADYHRPDRSISYYNKGELLGYLLDLALRHASGNQAGLDDVMRRLNNDFARRGRFYSDADLRNAIAQTAPAFAGVDDFFRDDVRGTQELDYATYLNYAGLRLETETVEAPAWGFTARPSHGFIVVDSVEPGSSGQKAGLAPGDILWTFNGQPMTELPEASAYARRPGEKARFAVQRGGKTFDVTLTLSARQETAYRIDEISHPTPEQLRVREGWLTGATGSGKASGTP
jgi:predicted metalloprotease with PDZ domain